MPSNERIREWRVCDTCGARSLCPVWGGTFCNHIVSKGRGLETCSGRYIQLAGPVARMVDDA